MKVLLSVLILLMFAWGCATTYDHPSKSAQAFEQDRLECEQVARQSLAAQGIEDC
jgi:hypothetical protein